MAWAERTSGGRWRGRYRDTAGRVQTVDGPTFTREAEARRAAAVAEEDARRRPGQRNAHGGRASWAGWVDAWWPRRKVQPGTLARDENRRRLHLDEHWGPMRLDKITREMVQDWVDELSGDAGLSPRSVANCYHLLSASLKAAVIDGRLSHTPCVGIELPPPDPPDERFLSPDEVRALFHFLPTDRDRLIAWTLVGTGMRWGELAGLHTHRVVLDQARLDVHETFDDRVGDVKAYTKSTGRIRRKRSVPVPPWLADMLAEHLDAAETTARCATPHRERGRCRSALAFPNPDGAALRYSSWRRGPWDRAVRLAGIGAVTIHDLRHTYASWLVQNGRHLEEVRDLLGHSTIKVTERYAHLSQMRWEGVRDVLGEVVSPLLDTPGRAEMTVVDEA